MLDFVVIDGDAGEMRDAADGRGVDGHEKKPLQLPGLAISAYSRRKF